MNDLNRRENSPIMKERKRLKLIISDELWNVPPNLEIINQCKAEIKSIDDLLDRLDLNGPG